MGFAWNKIEVTGNLSRHNSARDDSDNALWEKLCRQIEQLADDPEFEPLRLMVDRTEG